MRVARSHRVAAFDPHHSTAAAAAVRPRPRRAVWRAVLALWLTFAAWPSSATPERMLQAAEARGPQAVAGVRALQALFARLGDASDADRLEAVNDFFNRRIVFAEDARVWGQIDYWATPLETLAQGRGDCEDYVIAKYFSLLALGVPVAKLRLVYVSALVAGTAQAHMVLAYYAAPGAEPSILDNLVRDVRPASRRPDLEPVFSFNGEGLWQGAGLQTAGDPVARLSRWRELLTKVRGEGFEP